MIYMQIISPACPYCGSKTEITVTQEQYDRLQKGDLIHQVLEDFSPDIREHFISGICPKCWDEIFKYEEEEEDSGLWEDVNFGNEEGSLSACLCDKFGFDEEEARILCS